MNNTWNYGYASSGWKDRFRMFFRDNGVLRNLLIVNIGVSALLLLTSLVGKTVAFLAGGAFSVSADVLPWLACPADWNTLLFRPWTLLTSLFAHAGFWHLLFNMLMLYCIGTMFLRNFSSRKLLSTYLIGGIVGNLVYMASYHIFPVFEPYIPQSSCVGASGAIMAIMFAILIYQPNYRLQIWPFVASRGIALKWIALIFIVIDLLGISGGANAGGHFSHLGGAIYGSLCALWMRYGSQLRTSRPKTKRKKFKYYTSTQSQRPMSDYEFNAKKHADEERLDEILGKISKSGYDALTAEERDFLYHYKR